MTEIQDADIALSDLAEIPVARTLDIYFTKVDPQELGKSVAGWDNEQQAAFLTGLADGFRDLDGMAGVQMLAIRQALIATQLEGQTRTFVAMLADYIGEV